jgi:tetratricopeptide (TPR) repeat protein
VVTGIETARRLVDRGDALLSEGRFEEALVSYRAVLEEGADDGSGPDYHEFASAALRGSVRALIATGRAQDAERVADELIARERSAPRQGASALLVTGLLAKARSLLAQKRASEALPVLDELSRAAERRPELALVAVSALDLRAFALGALGREVEALAVRRQLIAEFGRVDDERVRAVVARGSLRSARHLDSVGRTEEALRLVDDLLATSDAEPARLPPIEAWMQRGAYLRKLDRAGESLPAFDAVIERVGDADEQPGDELLIKAWSQKIEALTDLGRSAEALEAVEGLLELLWARNDQSDRELLPSALCMRGFLLRGVGRTEEALTVFEDLIARFGSASPVADSLGVLDGCRNRLEALEQLGRFDAAIASADEIVQRYGGEEAAQARALVADALGIKSRALDEQGRELEKLAALDQLIEHFGDAPEEALQTRVAEALAVRAMTLLHLGRREDAETSAHALLARLEPEVDGLATAAAADQALRVAWAFHRRGLIEQALGVFRTLSHRLIASGDPAVRRFALRAQANAATCLAQLGDTVEAQGLYGELLDHGEDALALFEELIEHAERKTDPAARAELALAQLGRAFTLGGLERDQEALHTIDELLARFADDESDDIRQLVERARDARAELARGDHA